MSAEHSRANELVVVSQLPSQTIATSESRQSEEGRVLWRTIRLGERIALQELRAQLGIQQDTAQKPNVFGIANQVIEADLHQCNDESCVISHAGISHTEHAELTGARTAVEVIHGTDLRVEGAHHVEKPELAEAMNRNERPVGAPVLGESAVEIYITDGLAVLITDDRLVSGHEKTLGLGAKFTDDLSVGVGVRVYADGEKHSHEEHSHITPSVTIQSKF